MSKSGGRRLELLVLFCLIADWSFGCVGALIKAKGRNAMAATFQVANDPGWQAATGCSQKILALVLSAIKTDDQFDAKGFVSCKAMPASKGLEIVVFPSESAINEYDSSYPNQIKLDLHILIVDSLSAEVLAQGTQKEKYITMTGSDSYSISNLVIDAARYNLNDSERAFAVRANFSGAGGANGAAWTQLDMYIRNGSNIVPILRGMNVFKVSKSHVECEGSELAGGEGGKKQNMILIMGKNMHHDRYDILVRRRVNERSAVNMAGSCVVVDRPALNQDYTLEYNGHEYPIPMELRALGQ